MLPDKMPAASAISRTVVARKPFWANSSLAILTTSARRCDRPAPFTADAVARLDGWSFRDGLTAPLWRAVGQPPKRLLACRAAGVRGPRGSSRPARRPPDQPARPRPGAARAPARHPARAG